MWNVDPRLLCQRHLLGEHKELHMFVGAVQKGRSVAGFLYGLVDPHLVLVRHNELVGEMRRRGYRHDSPLDVSPQLLSELFPGQYPVATEEHNRAELAYRCQLCAKRQRGENKLVRWEE